MSDFKELFIDLPRKTVITINIDNELLRYLEKIQEDTKLSRSTIINIIVQKFKNENKDIIKDI